MLDAMEGLHLLAFLPLLCQIGRFHDIPAMLRQYNELYGKVLSGVASPMTVVKQLNRDVAGEVCGLVEDAEALFSAGMARCARPCP